MTTTVRRTTAETIHRPGLDVRLQVDRRNQRLKVISYQTRSIPALAASLLELAQTHQLGKIVLCARTADWEALLTRGFVLEGQVEQYYHGQPGFYMGYFLDGGRLGGGRHEEQQRILQACLDEPVGRSGGLPPGYEVTVADAGMAAELADVYDRVFASYPSPLTDPAYIRELMASGEGLFLAVTSGGQVVSAAAAEIDRENWNAELTNCATLPDHRGEGLMSVLAEAVEQADHGTGCLYSMARACSFGMNLVLRRAGYIYRGRLSSHAFIDDHFEDLNLWERPGSVRP